MKLATTIIALLIASQAIGANYWVAGTNSATPPDGYISVVELQSALDDAQPGDFILISPGTHPGWANTVRHGTAVSNIVIHGSGTNETIVTGQIGLDHEWHQYKAIHHQTRYLDVRGTNNLVQSNLFTGGTQGVYMRGQTASVQGPTSNIVSRNTFTSPNQSGNGMVIVMGYWNLVSSNLFTANRGIDVIRAWGVSNVLSDNTFDTIINGNEADPPTFNHADIIQTFESTDLRAARDLVFERNVLKDTTCQWGNLGGSTNADFGGWIFRNNVVYNSRIQLNNSMVGLQFYNNTIYDYDGSSRITFDSLPERGLYSHNGLCVNNLFIRSGSTETSGYYAFNAGNTNCVGGWNMVTDRDDTTKTGFSEPTGINGGYTPSQIFVSVNDRNFRLVGDSPAINTGTNLSGLFPASTDFTGATRGAQWDIGAFEYDGNDPDPPSDPSPLRISTGRLSVGRIE